MGSKCGSGSLRTKKKHSVIREREKMVVVGHVSEGKGGGGGGEGTIEPHYHAHNRTQEHGVVQ
jgi:hypothetical protein